jgi:aldehyde dehydrogenase (NAD+)
MIKNFLKEIPPSSFDFSGKSYSINPGLFINNKFVPSASGKMFESVNPATGKPIFSVYEADKADVDLAVSAATEAFKSWKKVPPIERSRLMFKLADLIERDQTMLSELESIDNGKAISISRNEDVPSTISCIRYYAGWCDKIHGKVIDVNSRLHTYTRMEPFGVVGQIIPWNYPLCMLAWKWGPALATGNCIVMKTSEKTPLSALKICELVVEAGFPPGVINLLSGYGHTAGNAIAMHMGISKVAFTGSTVVGRKIMEASAKSNLKKVSLELGGKSPNIIFADADLDEAVKWASSGIYENHGQVCCAGSRIFVQDEIYDEFMAKFTRTASLIKIGNPLSPDTEFGPLVDKTQFDRVLNYIKDGISEGAKCEIGGRPIGNEGFFIEPTCFTNVRDDMKIAKEEIFGPVACILKFKTVQEVIERANATSFGLAAGVHTNSIKTATKVANELEAGTVWINLYNTCYEQVPFGGFKVR